MTAAVKAPAEVTVQTAALHWRQILEGFREQYGREPREDSDDPAECRLARAAWGYRIAGPEGGAVLPSATPAAGAWWSRLEEYMAWKVRGHQPENARALNAWLSRQRCAARDGRLSPPFVLALEGLGQVLQGLHEEAERAEEAVAQVELAERRQAWRANLQRLYGWQKARGAMPRREGGGARERKLALWVACERAAAADGLLTEEQLEALLSIPGALV